MSVAPEIAGRDESEASASDTKALPKVQIHGLNFFYGTNQVLRSVTMDVPALKVTALIGPSGCGKTTLLRCMNRMHDLYLGNRYEGSIVVQPDGTDILDASVDPIQVRMRFGIRGCVSHERLPRIRMSFCSMNRQVLLIRLRHRRLRN